MKKSILVIGSNSFIAKNFVNNSKFKKKIFCVSTKDLNSFKNDFDFKKLKKILHNNPIRAIINFTSNNNNSTSKLVKDSKIILENINYHLEILELVKKKNILVIYFDSYEKFKSKNSSYKISKNILENIYKFYKKKYKLNVKKILLPTVIGNDDLNFERLVPYLLKSILNNKKILIKTKQKKIIFTFVDHVVSKIDNILSNSKKNFLIKKYEKKVYFFYDEFKKIHKNYKTQNKELVKIYSWYKAYFKQAKK